MDTESKKSACCGMNREVAMFRFGRTFKASRIFSKSKSIPSLDDTIKNETCLIFFNFGRDNSGFWSLPSRRAFGGGNFDCQQPESSIRAAFGKLWKRRITV